MANQYRVLNLLKKVDMQNASLKKWAVIKLLLEFPEARRIQFEGKCDNSKCRSNLYMSFNLPGDENNHCGWYCPSCHFSNAGSRERWTRKLGRGIA